MDADPGDGEAAHDAALPLHVSCYSRWWHHQASTSLQEHTQTHSVQTAMWTAEFAAPTPPLAHLLQPNQLNPSCNHSHSGLETCEFNGSLLRVWMAPKRCVRERSCWARGGRTCLQRDGDKDLNNILLDHHNRTRTEERNVPWILSWHPPATAQRLPQAEKVSLNPQRTNSGATNTILFIYFVLFLVDH